MRTLNNRYGERGFTMLEVLVTLVVLAIGLLGVASLQLNSLRYASMSAGRNQAAMFAEDMAERIRANPSGDYAVNGAAVNCYTAACDDDQRALFDLAEVRLQLQTPAMGGLQNGQLTVAAPASGGYVVTVNWNERNRFTRQASAVTVAAQRLDLYVAPPGVN